jgi:hypothetical protein
MDEALALVDAFLRGETVEHHGDAYDVSGAAVGPSSVQSPRPPIWLGGMRPGALRRAAAWDGWIGIIVTDDGSGLALTPDDVAARIGRIEAERAVLGLAEAPFDVALFADSRFADAGMLRAYGEAGATWWLESLSPMRGTLDDLMVIVKAGPPAIR